MAKVTCTTISFSNKHLSWSRTTKMSKDNFVIVDEGIFEEIPPYSEIENFSEEELATYSKKILSKCQDKVTLSFPTSKLICKTLNIPSIDRNEIDMIVENHIERDSPLPLEKMVYSYEVLSRDEISSLVLIISTPENEIINPVEKLVPISSSRISRIDANILGIIHSLIHNDSFEKDSQSILLANEEGDITICFLDGDKPMVIHSLGDLGKLSTEKFSRELGRALMQYCIKYNKPQPNNAILLGFDNEQECLLIEGIRELNITYNSISYSQLQSYSSSISQRTLSHSHHINLFPTIWKEENHRRKHKKQYTIMLSVLALLWLSLSFFLFGTPKLLDAQIKKLSSVSQQLEPQSGSVTDIRNRIDIIRRYSNKDFSALEVLREVSILLPKGIEISAFRFKGAERRVQIEGRADTPTTIYTFMDNLTTSSMFGENKLISGPTLNRQLGKNVFELTVSFNQNGGTQE